MLQVHMRNIYGIKTPCSSTWTVCSSSLNALCGIEADLSTWIVKEFHTPGEDVDRAINAEYEQSKAIIDACLAAGVKHVVYSALDDFPPDKRVAHCSAKAEGG